MGSNGFYGYKRGFPRDRASVDVELSLSESQQKSKNGTNKANCSKIHRRKGAKETTGNQSSKKVGTSDRRSQETSSLQTWNCCSTGDQKIPKIYWIALEETTISKVGERNCPRFQDWLAVSIQRCDGSSRSFRSLFGWLVWRHQLVCHPRQARHNLSKGHSTSKEDQRRKSLSLLLAFISWVFFKTSVVVYSKKLKYTLKTDY